MVKSNTDNVDTNRMPKHGTPYKYVGLNTDGYQISAQFERAGYDGEPRSSDLYPSAIESYLASNAGDELLDVCTTLRCEDGQVIDLYPTQELQEAAQAIKAAAPQLVGS